MHSSKHMENVSKDWVEFFAEANVQLLIPMHYETWVTNNPEFVDSVYKEMNDLMEERGLIGRVAPMERGKWYSLNLCISEA